MPFPMLVAKAEGARLTDIDGHEVDDFCLGDTGSMFGHAPAAVTRAIRDHFREQFLESLDFAVLDFDIGSLSLGTAAWLVKHDAGMRERVPFSFCSGCEQNRTHAGRLTDTAILCLCFNSSSGLSLHIFSTPMIKWSHTMQTGAL